MARATARCGRGCAAGIRTSKERVRRLMREAGLQAPHRVGKPRGPKAHNGTIRTERPDRMWGTAMTTTVTTEEGMASVFVAVDHCSVDCVGIHAAKSGNRFEALEPIRQGVAERFAGLEADVAEGLKVRHDHGPAYLSDDFQREIAYLGMTSSPSFVRAPEGNGYCEWFIRILKENLLWVRSFATGRGTAAGRCLSSRTCTTIIGFSRATATERRPRQGRKNSLKLRRPHEVEYPHPSVQ